MNLLNAAKRSGKIINEGKRFYHISTDEVYGSLGEGLFTETTAILIRLFRIQSEFRSLCESYGETWFAICSY
jgi:nucleoside-diphosphate-sugar epimerase